MKNLEFGNLKLKTTYDKGVMAGQDFALGYGRSANTYDRIFHYDCDTQIPTPTSLNPTKEFGASLWCDPSMPLTRSGTFLLSEEQRREMERKASECESALVKKSGLTPAEFGLAMAPNFPVVAAKIPVDAIRRLIPNYTFSVYLTAHWLHLYCVPNVTPFACSVFIRFPFAYEFEFIFEKSCDGSKMPSFDPAKIYFELTEMEKGFERDGLELYAAMKSAFDKLSPPTAPSGPEHGETDKPDDH
jgi:hypothetical protein